MLLCIDRYVGSCSRYVGTVEKEGRGAALLAGRKGTRAVSSPYLSGRRHLLYILTLVTYLLAYIHTYIGAYLQYILTNIRGGANFTCRYLHLHEALADAGRGLVAGG